MTVLLCDGNNLAMRSIHAMARSGLSSDKGVSTGPLLAFINGLSKHVKEEKPDRLVVCWDGGRSQYRVALDPQYKAHRLAMDPEAEEAKEGIFALAKEFLSLAGVLHIERPGVEADDLIAYYWRHHRPLDDKLVILSSDKDFMQLLIGGQVEQVRLSSAGTRTDRWTASRVFDEMGIGPDQLARAMALAGDSSDNLPGAPRFGMKTAIKALRKENGSLEAVLVNDPRVIPHVDRVRLNLQLVDLRSGLPGLELPPLPLFRPTVPGDSMYEYLISFLTKYQMKSVQSRFYDGSLWN